MSRGKCITNYAQTEIQSEIIHDMKIEIPLNAWADFL